MNRLKDLAVKAGLMEAEPPTFPLDRINHELLLTLTKALARYPETILEQGIEPQALMGQALHAIGRIDIQSSRLSFVDIDTRFNLAVALVLSSDAVLTEGVGLPISSKAGELLFSLIRSLNPGYSALFAHVLHNCACSHGNTRLLTVIYSLLERASELHSVEAESVFYTLFLEGAQGNKWLDHHVALPLLKEESEVHFNSRSLDCLQQIIEQRPYLTELMVDAFDMIEA